MIGVQKHTNSIRNHANRQLSLSISKTANAKTRHLLKNASIDKWLVAILAAARTRMPRHSEKKTLSIINICRGGADGRRKLSLWDSFYFITERICLLINGPIRTDTHTHTHTCMKNTLARHGHLCRFYIVFGWPFPVGAEITDPQCMIQWAAKIKSAQTQHVWVFSVRVSNFHTNMSHVLYL